MWHHQHQNRPRWPSPPSAHLKLRPESHCVCVCVWLEEYFYSIRKQVSDITWWVIRCGPLSVCLSNIVWRLVHEIRPRYELLIMWATVFPTSVAHHFHPNTDICSTVLTWPLQHRSVSVWLQPVQCVFKTNSLNNCIIVCLFFFCIDSLYWLKSKRTIDFFESVRTEEHMAALEKTSIDWFSRKNKQIGVFLFVFWGSCEPIC